MIFPSLSSPLAVLAAGLGAVVGVAAFLAIMLLATRRGRRTVVTIPPYATGITRYTPMPPRPDDVVPWPQRFTPSTQLSARALARMGIPVGPFGERVPTCEDDDIEEIEVEDAAAVTVAPVVVLAPPKTATESGPHPLSVIPKSSAAMRTPPSGVERVAPEVTPHSGTMMRAADGPTGASIADLSFDDAPTEIAETVFDEPPQPLRRSDPPKIRPIQPAPPRFQRRS